MKSSQSNSGQPIRTQSVRSTCAAQGRVHTVAQIQLKQNQNQRESTFALLQNNASVLLYWHESDYLITAAGRAFPCKLPAEIKRMTINLSERTWFQGTHFERPNRIVLLCLKGETQPPALLPAAPVWHRRHNRPSPGNVERTGFLSPGDLQADP
ncbi:hypothetical protein CBL_07915 [Carabus blaptoides fortunei]